MKDKQSDEIEKSFSSLRAAGPYLGLGTQLAATMVLMFFLGKWLDDYLNTIPLFVLVFSFLRKILRAREINGGVAGDVDEPGGQPALFGVVPFCVLPYLDEAILQQVFGIHAVLHYPHDHAKEQGRIAVVKDGKCLLILCSQQFDKFHVLSCD